MKVPSYERSIDLYFLHLAATKLPFQSRIITSNPKAFSSSRMVASTLTLNTEFGEGKPSVWSCCRGFLNPISELTLARWKPYLLQSSFRSSSHFVVPVHTASQMTAIFTMSSLVKSLNQRCMSYNHPSVLCTCF